MLSYAGISIIYFSFTGEPFLGSDDNYNLYIFIMGFVAIMWTLPELLNEFEFFRHFINRGKEVINKPIRPAKALPRTAKVRG